MGGKEMKCDASDRRGEENSAQERSDKKTGVLLMASMKHEKKSRLKLLNISN